MELRKFGPQGSPLGDVTRFGIYGEEVNGWAPLKANREVWMHTERTENKIQVRFVGLTEKCYFCFYVKGDSCQIGSEVFKPKSLRRFQNECSKVSFGKLKIELDRPRKTELIPLAGDGSFWEADFLLAFEIQPIDPQGLFSINSGIAN
jgi:hypothetical protein